MKDKQSYEIRDEICLLSAYYEWCSKEWMNIYERKRIQSCATEHFLSFHAVLMNGALWKFVHYPVQSAFYLSFVCRQWYFGSLVGKVSCHFYYMLPLLSPMTTEILQTKWLVLSNKLWTGRAGVNVGIFRIIRLYNH